MKGDFVAKTLDDWGGIVKVDDVYFDQRTGAPNAVY